MRSVVSRLFVAALMIGVLFGTSGCRKLLRRRTTGSGTSGTTGGSSGSTTSTSQDDADDQLTEKLDEYIKCLNTISSRAFSARKQYFTFIPRTGPTGKETFASVLTLTPGAASSCSTGAQKAKQMPPHDGQLAKLESVADDFSRAASDLDPLLNQLNQYFDNKDFRDDKWAKGKLLHPQVALAFERFAKADHELHTTLDTMTKPLAQRTLARIERDEGKKFRYHRKHVLNTARDLVETADPPGEDDDVDFTAYGNAFAEFEKALDDLRSYGSLNRADLSNPKTRTTILADSHFDSFVRAADDYKKHSKDFWRCLRDAPAAAKTPSGKVDVDKMKSCADGKPLDLQDNTIKKYNEFIRTSNSSQFP